jgi:hypothetical protein
MSHVPRHNPLIWPAALTTPIGPAPGTVAQSITAGLHGPFGAGKLENLILPNQLIFRQEVVQQISTQKVQIIAIES